MLSFDVASSSNYYLNNISNRTEQAQNHEEADELTKAFLDSALFQVSRRHWFFFFDGYFDVSYF